MTKSLSRVRLGLAGWYGYGNVGDELLLRVLEDRLRPAAVFSTKAGRVNGTQLHDVATLPAWSDRLDLLLIGGGGLLNDRWVARLPLQELSVPYGFLAVGIPHRRWLSDLEDVLARARFVTLRDHLALELFRDAYPDVEAWWLPDPAFMLRRRRVKRDPRLVVLNPRTMPPAWLREEDPADAEERQIAACASLIEELGKRADFVAVGFEESDRALLGRLSCRGLIVNDVEAIETVARGSVLVTSRLHGGIIAATQGTPCVLLDHQDKMRGLARLLGWQAHALGRLQGLATDVAETLESPGGTDTAIPRAFGALTDRILGFMAS